MSKNGFFLLFGVTCLFVVGLLMVFNTTAAEAIDKSLHHQTHHAFLRQLLYAGLGLGLGLGCYFVGHRRLMALSPFLLAGVTLALVLVLIPGVGMQLNGARRWMEIAGFSFQPSEFAKIAIPMFFIHACEKGRERLKLMRLLKILVIVACPLGLILCEPDNGTVGIVMMTLMALLYLMRVRWVYWALPVLVLVCGGALVAWNMPHVKSRIAVYMNPELDLRGKGHQPYQAKIAAGSGGVWGRGPGESLQKQGFLPEARSDYIAAIYAEEFGFVGMLVLLGALMAMASLGFRIAKRANDRQGFFLASILTFLLFFQAFLNLGVVSGLLPSKGTNLPFFSQGGSSLLAGCIALSLILSVERKRESYVQA